MNYACVTKIILSHVQCYKKLSCKYTDIVVDLAAGFKY